MAGSTEARRFSEADKARVLVALASNGGNVKRTARDTTVAPATIRRWRDQQARADDMKDVAPAVSAAALQSAVIDFVEDAERVRNKALMQIEARLDAGDLKPSELITTLGVLDDKVTRAKGLPTSKVEHTSALPSPDELRGLMHGFVAGAIAAAEQRHDEIVEAEVVEDHPGLPAPA